MASMNPLEDSLERHRILLGQRDGRFVVADHVLTRNIWVVAVGITRAPDAMFPRLEKAARIANQ